ncbi:sensor histidine kinase [Solicola gregarius]|uniref:Oxygen sensor histidine kinase NreB n=1 Tax=Solicola gregarius TaxID=2908642 RepID=A0AA46TDT1_9ACTN|nr:sensor histidine kinase [Solicola gregarius]UYM03436.1 sensor histidine kinase [Solicola gregarius]
MNTSAYRGVRPLLAGADRLETWLHIAFVVLTITSTWRYLDGHGLSDRGPWVLGGALLLVGVYASYRLLPAPVWCGVLVVVWIGLTALAPSFSWCAVPLAFVALRVLPYAVAYVVVAAMVVTVVVSWSAMSDTVDPTVIAGPIAIAVLAVGAYRALDVQATERQRLLDELHEAQGELAEAQHRAGVVAERARLSREIHDSVAQGLSSINLLLQAADQDWEARPAAAREHVSQAAITARDGLDEVRRVVRDLAPAELSAGGDLPAAVQRVTDEATRDRGRASVRVHGEPAVLPDPVGTALLRTTRGALANVVEHADASHVVVSLTYQPDSVTLDVRDDGRGFDPTASSPAGQPARGRGLAGIRARVEELGGSLAVESAPGDGTALAVSIPLNAPTQGRMS